MFDSFCMCLTTKCSFIKAKFCKHLLTVPLPELKSKYLFPSPNSSVWFCEQFHCTITHPWKVLGQSCFTRILKWTEACHSPLSLAKRSESASNDQQRQNNSNYKYYYFNPKTELELLLCLELVFNGHLTYLYKNIYFPIVPVHYLNSFTESDVFCDLYTFVCKFELTNYFLTVLNHALLSSVDNRKYLNEYCMKLQICQKS